MPKYSPVKLSVQPVEQEGNTLGYLVRGFMSKNQPDSLRAFVDREDYERSKRRRGEYLEMAKAIVHAVDGVSAS